MVQLRCLRAEDFWLSFLTFLNYVILTWIHPFLFTLFHSMGFDSLTNWLFFHFDSFARWVFNLCCCYSRSFVLYYHLIHHPCLGVHHLLAVSRWSLDLTSLQPPTHARMSKKSLSVRPSRIRALFKKMHFYPSFILLVYQGILLFSALQLHFCTRSACIYISPCLEGCSCFECCLWSWDRTKVHLQGHCKYGPGAICFGLMDLLLSCT